MVVTIRQVSGVDSTNRLLDLEQLLEGKSTEINAIARAASDGKRAEVVDGIAGLVATLATGNPLAGALVPFARKTIAKAFGNGVDEMLQRELAVLEKDEERQALFAHLDALIATALGQAILQLVRVQHVVKEEVLEALGGVRAEFEAFRQSFQAGLSSSDFSVVMESQLVEDGAVGVRLRPESLKRVLIHVQHVRGYGATGIEV